MEGAVVLERVPEPHSKQKVSQSWSILVVHSDRGKLFAFIQVTKVVKVVINCD